MLPLILSLLGSGAAGAGLLGASALATSPLIMGAIGSGLGTWAETGDLGKGLQAGLTSGMLGSLGGKLMNGTLLGGSATDVATQAATNAAKSATTQGIAQNAANAVTPGIANNLAGSATMQGAGMNMTGLPAPQGGIMGMFGGKGGRFMNGIMDPGALGSAAGAAMSSGLFGPKGSSKKDDYPYITQAPAANRTRYTPPAGYNPGVDGEFRYFGSAPPSRFADMSPEDYFAKKSGGGRIAVRMAEGGIAPMQAQMSPGGLGDVAASMMPPPAAPNEKDIVSGAIAAIQGKMSEQQAAAVLGAFVQQYGEDALRKLVSDLQAGKAPGAEGNRVTGPGGATDDMVPARVDGGGDVLLSPDEYVLPVKAVKAVGGGDVNKGASKLDEMVANGMMPA